MSWIDAIEGNRAPPDDRSRPVDSPHAAPAQDSPAEESALVSGGTDSERWQRSQVVRATRTGVHVTGVYRRCHESADDPALHRDRVDVQLFRGDAQIHRGVRQAGGTL